MVSNVRLYLLASLLMITISASAQVPGLEGLNAVLRPMCEVFLPIADLIMIMGALVGLGGSLRGYKWNSGDRLCGSRMAMPGLVRGLYILGTCVCYDRGCFCKGANINFIFYLIYNQLTLIHFTTMIQPVSFKSSCQTKRGKAPQFGICKKAFSLAAVGAFLSSQAFYCRLRDRRHYAGASELAAYLDPVGNLILAIGAVVGLIGGIRSTLNGTPVTRRGFKEIMVGWDRAISGVGFCSDQGVFV